MKYIIFGLVLLFSYSFSFADNGGEKIDVATAKNLFDVTQFIHDIESVPPVPPDNDCDFKEDAGEPQYRTIIERKAYLHKRMLLKRKVALKTNQCEDENRLLRKSYNQAYQTFNQKWLPALKTAITQGDAVAEIIMTVCTTTPVLDRASYASNCAKDEKLRQAAQLRLEAINFKPALIKREHYDVVRNKTKCPAASTDYDKNIICQTESEISRYRAMLEGIKVGNLHLSEHWNSCHTKSNNKQVDLKIEACQRLLFLTRSALLLSDRSYTAHMELTNLKFPDTYNAFDIKHLKRLDWSAFSDHDFQQKFNRDAAALASAINKNIDADLKRDARFGVFLVNKSGKRQFQ